MKKHPQLTRHGELKHLLTTEGLPRDIVTQILDTAEHFAGLSAQDATDPPLLRGRSVFNLFFERATRTRTSFEMAAGRLCADVVNVDVSDPVSGDPASADGARQAAVETAKRTAKPVAKAVVADTSGRRSCLDIIDHLAVMPADLLVVRHAQSGTPFLIAEQVERHATNVHVINAGDGSHADPTQGLLDLFTIRRLKGDLTNLRVAIVGDFLHSRVARSDIHALTTLGVPEVRAIGPRTLLPSGLEQLGARIFHDMDEGLRDVDVVIVLRLQQARLPIAWLPSSADYFRGWGLTTARLARARPDVLVLYSGPTSGDVGRDRNRDVDHDMKRDVSRDVKRDGSRDVGCDVMRDVEIASDLAESLQPALSRQVADGVAVRMAVMSILARQSGLPDPRPSAAGHR